MNNKLYMVLPCYNEQEVLLKTADILKNKLAKKVDKIIYSKRSGVGKGENVSKGIKNSTGDIVIIQDADLEYDPKDYIKVIKPIVMGEADVVYGSRFMDEKNSKGYRKNFLANRFLTKLSNFFTKLNATDMETCYKAFRRSVFKKIKIEEKRFGMEPELTAKVAKYKFRFTEVPISYYPRTIEEGKKINYKDGIEAIKCIIKYSKK